MVAGGIEGVLDGGEVYRISAGVTVSARIGNDPATSAAGAEAELPALVQGIATRVYARTQPHRYGFWLALHGQIDEANAVYRQLYTDGNAVDRIWALHGWLTVRNHRRRRLHLSSARSLRTRTSASPRSS